jgi:hypothetical protein
MKNTRHSYQVYKPTTQSSDTVMNRKMFIILDLKKKPMVHRDGHLMIFYKSKDAKSFIFKNKADAIWRIKTVRLDITAL